MNVAPKPELDTSQNPYPTQTVFPNLTNILFGRLSDKINFNYPSNVVQDRLLKDLLHSLDLETLPLPKT